MQKAFYTVAIGASAGALMALEEFFSELPADLPACYVVVLHLSPDHHSKMDFILSRYTTMPVHRIENGMEPEQGHVYVMPEGVTMKIHDGVLVLHQREPSKMNFAINEFLASLAQDQRDKSIAVILSGMGTDGTQGALDITSVGGIVLSQNPNTTDYKVMPQTVMEIDDPKMISSPRELGKGIARFMRQNLAHEPASQQNRSDTG